MDTTLEKIVIKQLIDISNEYGNFRSKSQYDDASDVLSNTEVIRLKTQSLSAIARTTGKESVYYEQALAMINQDPNDYRQLASLIGIVDSVIQDIKSGYLKSFEELIHADVFANFLEMAEYLVTKGYKDPAAVISGSTLEVHIKKLCLKFNITIDINGKNKKTDTLNSELVKSNVYSKLDQKNVTAWLGLRNHAAHGKYEEYDEQQVKLLISSIMDFLTRNPA